MKKRALIKNVMLTSILIFLTIGVGTFAYIKLTYASVDKFPPLKNGDLVFQTIKSPQTLAIMAASHSPYTHIGIIKIDQSGTPIVVEAVGPVREIPLENWIEQGVGGRVTIKRVPTLKEKDVQKVLNTAQIYYGRPYDFYFLFDKEEIYCSELVYYAFKEALQMSLGEIQKVGQLKTQNPAVKALIKERWEHYPPCQRKNATNFEGCYEIVMNQNLITPASIADDPQTELIYTNY